MYLNLLTNKGRHLLFMVLFYLPSYPELSVAQFTGQKNHAKPSNDLIRTELGLKYIYSFPIERTDVSITVHGLQAEIPIFDNELFIMPIMSQILSGRISVYNPNFWGDVSDIKYLTKENLTDTSQILAYMDAGVDTAIILDESGNISFIEQYIQPDLNEISGIFFMENWQMNIDLGMFQKDIIAYLPIRDYYEANEEMNLIKKRRLLFMVVHNRIVPGTSKKAKAGTKDDYELIYKDLAFDMNLYNKPYAEYLYRDELNNLIRQEEYEEWEYHHFDFFRHFDRDYFIQQLVSSVLGGKLDAFRPDDPSIILTANELEQLARIPRSEINSVIFHEDWYLNKKDLDLKKVVHDLILVRHIGEYDDYTGEFIRTRKEPLFLVKFGQ